VRVAGRTILLNLVGRDRISRVMRGVSREMANATEETSRLNRAMAKLDKVGKAGGIATASAGVLALARSAAPAVAAVAALPAAMAAAKVASGTLKVGLVGVGDAMSAVAEGDAEKLNESLKKLSPNAKAFVKQASAMRKQVMGVQQATQNRLFRGLDDDLSRLGKSLLPTARKGMVGVAGALNGIGHEAAKTASTPWFRGQVAKVFQGTTGIVRTLQGAVRPLLESVLRLAVAGMPLVRQLTAWAVQGIRVAAAWLRARTESGQLAHAVAGVSDGLAALGRIGSNLIQTLINITGQAVLFGGASTDLLGSLERLTGAMAAWTASASGQAAAAGLFRSLGQSAAQLAQVLPLLLSPLGLLVKALAGLPPGLQDVVGQMVGWSIIIGVVGSRLKILTGVTATWTAATWAASHAVKVVKYEIAGYSIATVTATAATRTYAGAMRLLMATNFAQGFMNINAAMTANAPLMTRLGAALKSQIMLWRQMAAAQGVSTARVIAHSIATKIAAVGTALWTAAQWLLNAALLVITSPISLIVIGIMLLVGAIVLLYKKNEAFRNLVNAAWAAIKNAVMQAWATIKPILSQIAHYLLIVVGTALRWYWAYVKFVFTTVWTIISYTWTGIKAIFIAIAGFLQGPLRIAWIVIQNTIKIVWIAIQIYIKVAWALIKGYFNLMKFYVTKILAPIFLWLYSNVVKPAFNAIVATIKANWNAMKVAFNAIRSFLAAVLGPAFRLLRSVATTAWNGLKGTITSVWTGSIRPSFNALKSALGTVRSAFSTAVSAIRKIWGGLKSAAKEPVNFVIGIYNKGIVSLVNKLAGFAGVKTRLTAIPKLARGGTLDNPLPVQPMMTNGPMAIVGEGRQRYPEYVIPTDPRFRGRAQGLWAAAGRDLMSGGRDWTRGPQALGGEGIAFARGGSLQAMAFGGVIGKFVDGVKNWTIGNVGKAAEGLLSKVLGGAVPGSGVFRDTVAAIPGWIKKTVLAWIKGKVTGGVGGKGVQRGLAFARSQSGKPYVWGGVGPGGYDCSGFMSAIVNVIKGRNPYSRLFSTRSFTGGDSGPSGFRKGLRSGFTVGVTNAGVGHMAGTLGGVNVESSGSRGVHMGPGARGTNDGLFPMKYGLKFDSGGMLPRGWSTVYNGLSKPEPIFPSTEAAAAYGKDGPLVNIEKVEVTEAADVDMLAGRLGFAIRAASFG
jgi:phage-related protein